MVLASKDNRTIIVSVVMDYVSLPQGRVMFSESGQELVDVFIIAGVRGEGEGPVVCGHHFTSLAISVSQLDLQVNPIVFLRSFWNIIGGNKFRNHLHLESHQWRPV